MRNASGTSKALSTSPALSVEREARFDAGDGRHDAVAERRHVKIEIAERLDMRAVEADFLLGLAQRRRQRIDVALVDLAAGKRNLPRMIGQMLRALRQQHGRLRVIDHCDQHRGRADRPHLGDLRHHRIGVMVAARRRHAGSVMPGGTSSVSRVRARVRRTPPPRAGSPDRHADPSGLLPQAAGFRHRKKFAARHHAEHRLAVDARAPRRSATRS